MLGLVLVLSVAARPALASDLIATKADHTDVVLSEVWAELRLNRSGSLGAHTVDAVASGSTTGATPPADAVVHEASGRRLRNVALASDETSDGHHSNGKYHAERRPSKCTLSRADNAVGDDQESVVLHLHQRIPGMPSGLKMKFGVRTGSDFVSKHIQRTGQVLCDDLLLRAMVSVLAKHAKGASATTRQGHDDTPRARQGRERDDTPKARARPLFVDIGGNIGSCTAVAGLLGFDVITVEPNPANVHFVKKNALLNGLVDSVRVLPCGLSNVTMELTFRYTTGNMGMGTFGALPETYINANRWGKFYDASTSVPVIRMDEVPDLRGRAIDLIKVDTEGHEGRVIRGSGAMLDNGQLHTMYLEDHFAEGASDTESMPSIQAFLSMKGYRLVAGHANVRGYLYERDAEVVRGGS